MRWCNPEGNIPTNVHHPRGCVRDPSPEDVTYRVIDASYAHHCRGGDFSDLLKIVDFFEIS
jgi:hypothetical protein